jgi:lipoprotein-anchoring transpeptidase ErfK/SrfK
MNPKVIHTNTHHTKAMQAETINPATIQTGQAQILHSATIQTDQAQMLQATTIQTDQTQALHSATIQTDQTQMLQATTIQIDQTQALHSATIQTDQTQTFHSATIQTGKVQETTVHTGTAQEKAKDIAVPDNIASVKKKRRLWKIAASIFGVIILLLVYLLPILYFRDHFLPNTYINEKDYSFYMENQAAEDFSTVILDYSLEVLDQDGNIAGKIVPSDIGATVSAAGDFNRIMGQQSEFAWPMSLMEAHRYELSNEMEFSQEMVRAAVESWDICQPENMVKPQDAFLSEYVSTLSGYEIIAETPGSTLDVDKVQEVIIQALELRKTSVDLAMEDCYIRARITKDNTLLQQKCDTLNQWTRTKIRYDWNDNEVLLDGDTIHTWIVEKSGRISLDEDALLTFVKENAQNYDTYGKRRNFLTTLGTEISLPSGAYGWKTDVSAEAESLKQLIYEGTITEREPEYSSKGAWKGINDIGNSYVEIDLTHQHLYLYEKGVLLLETDFVSGNMSNGCATPAGVFGLTYKTRNAVLRGEDYETPVHYWMPFNGNVGMHDATWRVVFGGDIYLNNGSHGCVNLPINAAESIYSYISTGFPVICYY